MHMQRSPTYKSKVDADCWCPRKHRLNSLYFFIFIYVIFIAEFRKLNKFNMILDI